MWICDQPLSTDCGQKIRPQGFGLLIHRRPTGCVMLSPGSPHPCPLFGNETPGVTGPSESRHIKVLVGLWGNRIKLGTELGTSTPPLCTGCAELFAVHRTGQLSTVPAHRGGGQKIIPELRRHGYPRFPQPLLLLPPTVTGELASKWVLCTTCLPSRQGRAVRLDPDPHRLSVA